MKAALVKNTPSCRLSRRSQDRYSERRLMTRAWGARVRLRHCGLRDGHDASVPRLFARVHPSASRLRVTLPTRCHRPEGDYPVEL